MVISRPSGIFGRQLGFDDAEFGVGAPRESEDAIADGEVLHAFAELAHDAGNVAAEDGRKGYGEMFFRRAGAHLPVDGVKTGGADGNEDLAGSRLGVGEVFVLKLRRWPVFVQDDGFHAAPLLG